MSESDTMFNERDRRCAAVQFMHSTDPSNDNMTIASTLEMQIRSAKGDENKVSGYSYGLWCGFKWGPHHAISHLRSRLESQHQSVPGCAEVCGDPLVQSGGRWQTLGVAAGLCTGQQVQRDPGLDWEGVLLLYIDLWPGQTCHSKVIHRKEVTHFDGSYGKKSRRRAWLTIWDKVKSHGTVIDWCTGREWPVKCMTVISAWWQSNMAFQG